MIRSLSNRETRPETGAPDLDERVAANPNPDPRRLDKVLGFCQALVLGFTGR